MTAEVASQFASHVYYLSSNNHKQEEAVAKLLCRHKAVLYTAGLSSVKAPVLFAVPCCNSKRSGSQAYEDEAGKPEQGCKKGGRVEQARAQQIASFCNCRTMESPSLSSGVLLSPSYGVPPPTGAALGTTPTTMESNEQASAAGEHIQHGESTSHLEAPLNAVSSSSSPLNGNNGSLPAGSSSSTSAQAPAAAAASTATTVAGSAKKKKECV